MAANPGAMLRLASWPLARKTAFAPPLSRALTCHAPLPRQHAQPKPQLHAHTHAHAHAHTLARAGSPSLRPAGSARWRSTAAALVGADKYRNVAVIAHVDHGKTTLIDALFKENLGKVCGCGCGTYPATHHRFVHDCR